MSGLTGLKKEHFRSLAILAFLVSFTVTLIGYESKNSVGVHALIFMLIACLAWAGHWMADYAIRNHIGEGGIPTFAKCVYALILFCSVVISGRLIYGFAVELDLPLAYAFLLMVLYWFTGWLYAKSRACKGLVYGRTNHRLFLRKGLLSLRIAIHSSLLAIWPKKGL